MYRIRYSEERGKTETDRLESWHTFSFADYYDPHQMGFSDLRVLTQNRVAPGGGFNAQPGRDMEILNIVLEGRLEYSDDMGHKTVLEVGDIQKITAGPGIAYEERNALTAEPLHFLQIWIYSNSKDLKPAHIQKCYSLEGMRDKFRIIAAPTDSAGAIAINQDAEIYMAKLQKNAAASVEIMYNRKYWVHVATGKINVHGETLMAGDGMAIADEKGLLEFKSPAGLSTVILFNLRNTIG